MTWQNGSVDEYMKYYSESQFKSLGMNWKKWKLYKEKLAKKYSFIKVEVNEPTIYSHKDELVIQFSQAYKSDLVSDFGKKTLFGCFSNNLLNASCAFSLFFKAV